MNNIPELKQYLNEHSISYRETGKNISKKCIGICCPYCSDGSFHGGIFKDTFVFKCFRCGVVNNIKTLSTTLTGIPFNSQDTTPLGFDKNPNQINSNHILQNIKNMMNKKEQLVKQETIKCVQFPNSCISVEKAITYKVNNRIKLFLNTRKIDIKTAIKHSCMFSPIMSRLILPVYFEKKLVSWQARALNNNSEIVTKYLTCPGSTITKYLYGYDGLPATCNKLFLVEGVFDQWRLEPHVHTIALFTNTLSNFQKSLIIKKQINHLYICLDFGMLQESMKIAYELKPFFSKITVLCIPSGDPDSLGFSSIINKNKYLNI